MANLKPRINDLTEAEVFGPVGYIATCLAHIRTGHEINLIEYGCIAVAPTQAEVDHARHMAETLADDYATAGEPGPFGRRPDDNQQQEEEEPVPSLVNDRVQQQINAARARRDRLRAQRQALDAARKAGLKARYAAKLAYLAQRDQDTP